MNLCEKSSRESHSFVRRVNLYRPSSLLKSLALRSQIRRFTMLIDLTAFVAMAAHCGPSVHVETLAAIAQAESGFHSGAVSDNTDKRHYHARNRNEAIALATNLIGMTIDDAFDPCKNLTAGARILATAYRPEPDDGTEQAGLLRALSRYNTGHPTRGLRNGYAVRVQSAAEQVVPAIRLRSSALGVDEKREAVARPVSRPAPWDVFGQARYTRTRSSETLMRSRSGESTDATSTAALRFTSLFQRPAIDRERSGDVPWISRDRSTHAHKPRASHASRLFRFNQLSMTWPSGISRTTP
jgi:type IV secretion system protein VirB1